jgi:hypothetical protein
LFELFRKLDGGADACVRREIEKLIEPIAWKRCETVNKAEQASLRTVLDGWRGGAP